jgi:hypothetical protein
MTPLCGARRARGAVLVLLATAAVARAGRDPGAMFDRRGTPACTKLNTK